MPSAGFLITAFYEVPPELFKELTMNFPSKFCACTQPDRATASHKYLTVKRLGSNIQKHMEKRKIKLIL
jgi:hypothetical protein